LQPHPTSRFATVHAPLRTSRPATRRKLISRLEEDLARATTSAVALAVSIGALVALAFQQGGYFPAGYLRTGAVAFAGLGIVLLTRRGRRLPRPALVAMVGMVALTLWTWLSLGWTSAPVSGWQDLQRNLCYVGILGLAVEAVGSGRLARFVVWAVLIAASFIVLAGLHSRLFPQSLSHLQVYRLAYPFGYWNTFGALAGFAATVAAGLAAERRTSPLLRSLCAVLAVLCLVTMYFSLSRGAWLAVFAGAVVLVVVSPNRIGQLITVLIVGGLSAIAIARLGSLPALVDNPFAGSGQAAAGRSFAPLLIILAVAAGLLQWLIVAVEPAAARRLRSAHGLRASGRAALIVAAIAALVTAGALAPRELRLIRHGWHSFMQTNVPVSTNQSRLSSLNTSRSDAYRVALDEWKHAPVIGGGAGSYPVNWYRLRHVPEAIQNAHSLYLETMAELGLIGLLLLALLVGSVLWAGFRARRTAFALRRGHASAVIAASTVWLVHTGLDWDWQVTSFTGLALTLAATLFPEERPAEKSPRADWRSKLRFGNWRYSLLLVPVCFAATAYLWAGSDQASRLDDANRLGAAGNYAASLREAATISMVPFSWQARVTAAFAFQDVGELPQADARFAAAAQADPHNWYIRMDWASELLEQGRRPAARHELRVALRLNPKLGAQLVPPLSSLR
jgi:hypothetical protein